MGAASSSEPASPGVADSAVHHGLLLAADPGVPFFVGGLVVFTVAGLRGGTRAVDG